MRQLLATLILIAAILAPSATVAASNPNSKVVYQAYDSAQQITETHLGNGLIILTKESHAAPVAQLRVVYKVGSRDEVSGATGLSHILEHMMFKGTQTLPAGAIDYLFRQAGADNNANTGTDYTQYFELVASNKLPAMIRLEADRMEHSAFRPNDLASEMTVVRSELEGDTNSPGYELYGYGLLPIAFSAHPYRWPAIGFVSDVEAVQHNRQVIYSYYKQHYMPNNAVVVITGDFKTSAAIALCQKYFGVYSPGVLYPHHITPEPPQHGEKRVILHRPGTTGEILVAFHDPGLGTPDHYTMDVIGTILSGGVSARMYQDLVNTGLAQDASMEDPDQKDPFLDIFDATPQSGVSLDQLEAAIHKEIVRLQTTTVSSTELRQAVNQIDASFVYDKDSISSESEVIGEYAAISPLSYKYEDTYLANIHKVTPAMIQGVANKYFVADNETVARFEPIPLAPGQTLPPPPSGEHFGSRQNTSQQVAEFRPIAHHYGLDKITTPAVSSRPTRTVLPNGLTVIVQANHANQDISIGGYIRAGTYFGGANREVAPITAQMAQRGTSTKSYFQLAQQLDEVGAGIGLSPGEQTIGIDGECLTKDFDRTLGTLADELMNASFPQDELAKAVSENYSDLEQQRQNTGGTGGAGTLAEIAFARAIFPANHPYWSPTLDELEAQTKSMSRDSLASFYHMYYRPDSTVLVIVGDIDPRQAIAAVRNAFGAWPKPDTPAPQIEIPDTPVPATAPAAELLSIPDEPQTSILFGFPGELKRTDPDYYAASLANYILGGDVFASRLGHQIRDVDGLSYTVYSQFNAQLGAGAWSAFAGTNPANANRALAEMKRITTDFVQHGATQDELHQAKVFLTGAFPSTLETNEGVAEILSRAELYHLGLDYPNRYIPIIQSVTLAQVNAAAKKHLRPDRGVVIMSGATPK